MKASETKLQPIIEGTKQYVVPLFQRSYSWEKKEWDVLWNDLVELCEMEGELRADCHKASDLATSLQAFYDLREWGVENRTTASTVCIG